MKQAVIYARVSSKDQEREGYSIPAQLKLLREYARTHEFEIVREFLDVETAKISRPQTVRRDGAILSRELCLPHGHRRKD